MATIIQAAVTTFEKGLTVFFQTGFEAEIAVAFRYDAET